IESARANPKAHLPYGMFLTRLFRHVMEHYPHLDNGIYDVVERVMRPLALRQARRPRSDSGKARHSVSSTSSHHNRGSLSYQRGDDEDDGASRASTPSPTTYLNSLRPLDYQPYDIPTSSKQNNDLLFERQTDLLNQTQQMHKELRVSRHIEVVKRSEVVKRREVVKPPKCSSCKIFGHYLGECPKNLSSDVTKNLKNHRQAVRSVPVVPKVGFKPVKQVYRHVSKITTNTSGKKKQDVVPRQEVSNSNPFVALNSIENDDDLGTNEGNLKSAGKGSLKVVYGSSSNTPILDKIDKLKLQILDGKLMLVDDDGNPLVPTSSVDSESEVEVVFDETVNLMASTTFKGGSDRCYGTNSLLEQGRETKRDEDYDPYDDDLYESHDMFHHLQAICDDLDITICGRKKKYIIFDVCKVNCNLVIVVSSFGVVLLVMFVLCLCNRLKCEIHSHSLY
nr:zinc knuckle CX2CX4HX4C [Tanacetum cinerariifolium]